MKIGSAHLQRVAIDPKTQAGVTRRIDAGQDRAHLAGVERLRDALATEQVLAAEQARGPDTPDVGQDPALFGRDPRAGGDPNDPGNLVRGFLNPTFGVGGSSRGGYVYHWGGNLDNGQGAGARFYWNEGAVEVFVSNEHRDIWSAEFQVGRTQAEGDATPPDSTTEDPEWCSTGSQCKDPGASDNRTQNSGGAEGDEGTEETDASEGAGGAEGSGGSEDTEASEASEASDSSEGTEATDTEGAEGAEEGEEGAAEYDEGAATSTPVPVELRRRTEPGRRDPEPLRRGGAEPGCGNGEGVDPDVPDIQPPEDNGAQVADHLPPPPGGLRADACFEVDDRSLTSRNLFDRRPLVNPGLR